LPLQSTVYSLDSQILEAEFANTHNDHSNTITAVNQSQVKEDVRNMQAQAVNKFALRNYSKACEIFTEALSVLQQILPPTHPDCFQITKSIEACNKKLGLQL
jgi:N-acetylglucosamine kinase-like BadF-type ATPase